MLSDDEARRRLRDLKQQLEHAEAMRDRFGDEWGSQTTQKLRAEIEALPVRVRQAEEAEFKLQLLTCAVEDYVIARAAQFLPDAGDLWAAVQAMPGRRDAPETPAEKPVVQLLDELRPLPASQDDIKKAVLKAAALEGYKQPVYRQLTGARRRNLPPDYRQTLKRQVREFMAKVTREGAIRSGLPPLDSRRDLLALVREWERQTPEEARGGTYWTRFARQTILSQINVLRRLGLSQAEIDGLIEEAFHPHT